METPTPRAVMGMTGRIEQAKRGAARVTRPSETYRSQRRALAKAIYRLQKRGSTINVV